MLPDGTDDPTRAAEQLTRARPSGSDRCDSDDDGEDDSWFVPDAGGYRVTFADGIDTRVRFRMVGATCAAEFRTPNRSVSLPQGQSEAAMAEWVLAAFAAPHTVVPFSEEGRSTYQGLATGFTVRCAAARDSGDVIGAARLGMGPWQLAMLAAGLLVLEIGLGEHEAAGAGQRVCIEQHHVVRAYTLLRLLMKQRQCWQGDGAGCQDAEKPTGGDDAARGTANKGQLPPHADLYGIFAPSQAAAVEHGPRPSAQAMCQS